MEEVRAVEYRGASAADGKKMKIIWVILYCYSAMMYGKHYIDITFTAELISDIPTVMEPEKIESVAWYDPESFPEPLFEPVHIAFEALKNGQQYFESS